MLSAVSSANYEAKHNDNDGENWVSYDLFVGFIRLFMAGYTHKFDASMVLVE